MAVSKRTRYEVLKRDNFTCRYCRSTEGHLRVDHVTPTALGGTDNPDNLVAACHDCNAGKSSTAPDAPTVEDVKQVDILWAGAIKRAARVMASQRRKEQAYLDAFHDSWMATERGRYTEADPDSVARLYVVGLPKSEMLYAIGVAIGRRGVDDRFAYFMGICWRRVTEMQETAKELLAADSESA